MLDSAASPSAAGRVLRTSVWPHQAAVLQAATPEVYLVAGAGAGKTRAGVLWALERCLRNPPGTRGMVVAPTYPVLRQSTMRAFLDLLDEFGISYGHNKAEHVVTIDSRTIFFRSADNPASLVGADLAWLWLDEAALMDRMVYVRAAQRVRDPRATVRQMLCTSTPEGTRTWMHEREQRTDVTTVRASTMDNAALTQDVLDNLRSIYANDPAGWRQYVEGIATDLTGNIYTQLSAANVKPYEDPRPTDELVIGWDFNVHCMVSVVGIWRPHCDTLHIVGDHVTETVNGTTTAEHAEALRDALIKSGNARMGDHGLIGALNMVRVRAYIDASGRQQRSSAAWTDEVAVRNAGFQPRAPAANPLVRDRINTVQHALHQRRLLIDDKRAPRPLRALREHARDRNGEPQKRWVRGDFQADHWADAIGYMTCALLPVRLQREF